MSRYRGPRLRITRRLGQEIPGLVQKTNTNGKEKQPPGQHGALRRKNSQYSIRLQEKQKVRYHYGITESQMIRYVKKARRLKGSTGEIIMNLLEKRLDVSVYRLGYAPTIRAARQLVSHGHVRISGKKINIPSYECSTDDKIEFLDNSVSGYTPKELSVNELLIVEYYSRK